MHRRDLNDGTYVTDPLAAFRLDSRVAIVTGASSGLGARFARVLDAAGASVVLAARRGDRLQRLASELREAHPLEIDLADPQAPGNLIAETLERFGQVDIVVNNAGIGGRAPSIEQSHDEFSATVAVNLVAPFLLSSRAAETMIATGRPGSIVNISSIRGLVGIGQMADAAYAASKGGLVNMTRELASEWARSGIRVNTIAPGWFRTEMTEGRMFGDERSEQWIKRHTPMGRSGEANELDGALLYLASDASSYVTGAVLPVDGGWTSI